MLYALLPPSSPISLCTSLSIQLVEADGRHCSVRFLGSVPMDELFLMVIVYRTVDISTAGQPPLGRTSCRLRHVDEQRRGV